MRRAVTGTLCALVLTFVVVPMRASQNPAVVIKGQTCGLLDGDGGFASGGDSITVTNHGGVTSIVCRATKIPNSQGQSVYWGYDNTGFECGTELGATKDWKEHVSASGNATLSCHLKN